MGSERYWVGRGSPRWQDRRNWSRSSGGLPGANPPGRGELAVLDAGSGSGDADLFGMVCSMRVSRFQGSLVSPTGQRINFAAPPESHEDAPKISATLREALADRNLSWRQAVREGLAAVAELRRRLVLVPVVAGGSTIIGAAGGGNWTASATWVGNVAPTAADDAQLTATSGNVTVNSGALCRSLDCTGYLGTLTHNAAATLTIGDATAGAGNVALKLAATMTYTLTNVATSAISFASTSATQQTIATAGKTLGNVTLGSGASPPSFLLSDGLTVGATATVTHSRGTFNTNGQTCSWGLFVSNSGNLRTVTLGASAITMTGAGSSLSTNSITNLTWTANTATVTFTALNAVWFTTSLNTNGTSIVFTGGGTSTAISGASGTFTCANLTVTGTVSKTDGFLVACGQITCTGTLNVTGNSTVNRVLVQSNILGTARTLSAAVVSFTNVDFMDITAAGVASPFGGTSIGDALGNTSVTFNAPATQTFVGGTKSWSDPTAWTSRVPLPQDDVIVATTTAGTLTADMPRLGKTLTFTGFNKTLAVTVSTSVYGNLVFASGMTVSGTSQMRCCGRSAQTITSAGITLTFGFQVLAPGGSYAFQDNTVSTSTHAVNVGTFDCNGKNVTGTTFTDTGTGLTRTIALGAGTFSLSGTGTVWSAAAGLTITGTGIIDITGTTATAKTFAGASLTTYPTLRHVATGSAALTITGTNTFANLDLECSTARTITIPVSVAQTVTGTLTIKGASGQNLSIVSSTPGTKASLIVQKAPYITNPFVTPSTDVRIVGRQRRQGVTIQDPAVL